MITDTARSLTMDLITAIIADKRLRGVSPDYALLSELRAAIRTVTDDALNTLSADGRITLHLAGVNRIPAYSITSDKPTPDEKS